MYSRSKLEELKNKYKHLDPSTLENNLLMEEGRNSGYVCPHCGNGTGEDGTGITWQLIGDGFKGYCFKCLQHFDVFDLIAKKYSYNIRTQFTDVIAKAQEIFGDSPRVTNQKPKKKEIVDFFPLIKTSWANLDKLFAEQSTWRGLTKATLVYFGCGYLPDWSFKGFKSERVIIPTSRYHFLARYVGKKPLEKDFQKPHRGEKEIFGDKRATDALQEKPDSLIFVVEGEIDAMSIYQSGFNAVAISGSGMSAKQANILKAKFPQNTKFIVMLDNDETGRKNSPDITDKIRKLGFACTADFLDSKFSDANDWLINDESGLKNELARISSGAKKFFSDNPPAQNSELPQGIVKTEIDGVKEITSDYKPPEDADEDDDEPENTIQFTQEQILNCPLNLKVPTGFSFTPSGIFHKEKNKNPKAKNPYRTVLDCATPIIPTRILMKKDRSDKQVELAYYERSKNIWHKISVPATTLAKTQNITDLAAFGVDINSTHARQLSDFLMKIQHEGDNMNTIPQAILCDQTGWLDDCKNFVYPPEGVINGENYVVKDNGFNYEQKFSTAGSKFEWFFLFHCAHSCYERWWCRYALGLVLAAPLVKPCNTRNWQGVLISPSGSGKSAVAKLAISIFGNPEKYHTTFNGTNNFSDELAARLNDLPCWIDEFQAADKKMREDFQNFIYNYAEGKTRGRLSRNADIKKQFEFRGTRLCTSEQVVMQNNFMQGAFNRILQIQGFRPLGDALGRELHEKLSQHYGHYGKMWIEYIAAHRQEITDTYDALRVKYRRMNFIPHHLQQICLAYAALEHFWRMVKEDIRKAEEAGAEGIECIESLPDDMSPLEYLEGVYRGEDKKPLGDIYAFRELLPTPQESNNVVRAKDLLAETIRTMGKHFDVQEVGGTKTHEMEPVLGYKFLGGDVGFYPQAIKEYLNAKNFLPVETLMMGLKNEGLLVVSKNKKLQLKKRCGDKGAINIYYVKREAFGDEIEDEDA